MDTAINQINEHIKDKKFFTARWLVYLSAESGLEPLLIAQCLASFVATYLCFGSQAHFLANLILIVYPVLVTYVYVDEKPSRDYLLIYWCCWGGLTLFDRVLERIPFYYVIKICLLAMLFLDPWCYCIPIKQYLEDNVKNKEATNELKSNNAAKQKSPPPEKPDMTKEAQAASEHPPVEPKNPSTRTAILPVTTSKAKEVSSTRTAILPLAAPKTGDANSTRTAIAPPPKPKSDYIGSEQTYNPPPQPITSTVDVRGRKRHSAEDNPMTMDKSYRLSLTSEGISNREIDFATNLHDLVFRPMERLIFNAPFDYDNTYHIKVQNTSHHRIAFAIKCNAIPRILAYPPSTIINPKQEMNIAVTLAKFDILTEDVSKDRIVFEYVLLKKSQEHIKEFTHKILENAEIKRRKNIKIEYNP